LTESGAMQDVYRDRRAYGEPRRFAAVQRGQLRNSSMIPVNTDYSAYGHCGRALS